jgi:hypothetical protein
METVTISRKAYATHLLRRYDTMRREMRALERELNRAATDYGREIGCFGFTKDMLLIRLENEGK